YDTGNLEAGVEDILVRGALGPESATDGGGTQRVHADLPRGIQSAIDPVDSECAQRAGEHAESAALRPGLRLGPGRRGYCRAGGNREQAAKQDGFGTVR